MFNFLVKFQPWLDGRDTIPAERVFGYTDPSLVARFKPGGQLDVAALSALPTLFVQETSGQQDQAARVGTISRLRNNGGHLVIDYAYDLGIPAIPNRVLENFARDLDIADLFEFSRTHWAVKDADLYRALLRSTQLRRPQPRVFQLSEFANVEPRLVSAMMPFHTSFDPVYAALRSSAESAGLRCRRADDIWENPAVMQDVVTLIDRSSVVICDCTGRNQTYSMR
jgi:hypothetical protein